MEVNIFIQKIYVVVFNNTTKKNINNIIQKNLVLQQFNL